ncbi:MAG: helix-turn-helix domain-containing protein [Clostridia bacterium]|nr:helix-turn-helix domain-containing protein [Clostridia bacterium]
MTYPDKLPLDIKPVWYYADCFPANFPYRLISVFLHRDYKIDMHCHDFYELNLIISGKGVHYTKNERRETSVGDVIIIPPGTYHGYYNIDGLNVYHMLIHKNFFNRYYSDLNMLSPFSILFATAAKRSDGEAKIQYFHADAADHESMLSTFCELDALEKPQLTDVSSQTPYLSLLSYTQALILIVKLCNAYKTARAALDAAKGNSSSSNLLNVIDYIHLHYAEKITVKDLCAVALMSKTLLTEQFNKTMGQSPSEYVNYYRILVAKKLLTETDMSIARIAAETGFFDNSHFSKTYIKFENISPLKLRKTLG